MGGEQEPRAHHKTIVSSFFVVRVFFFLFFFDCFLIVFVLFAPQKIGFGPAGDPRGAGIGSPYAIQLCWSCHREIIHDHGEIAESWTVPLPS